VDGDLRRIDRRRGDGSATGGEEMVLVELEEGVDIVVRSDGRGGFDRPR
jgi:hypothetical protein